MEPLERILELCGEEGVETTFRIGERSFHVFAFPSPGRDGNVYRWNLYEAEGSTGRPMRGLSFGLANDVREAMEEVFLAARRHVRGVEQEVGPSVAGGEPRAARSFRPTPLD
jgi:hypothetical protein